MVEKILLVGGAGYIGGHLTDSLIQNGYDVTVYDNLMYEQRFLKQVPFIYGDIRNRKKLFDLLPKYNIIIWLAAIVGDGACAVDPFLTQTINEDCVKWLAKHYTGKIIFTSTCSVYGINNELLDEDSLTNPLSVYAETKLSAEQSVLKYANNPLIFRLGTLFGVGDQHSRLRFDLVSNILSKKAALGEELSVFGGEQWRPLLHVKDVATAIVHCIKNNISGLYNLSCKNYKICDIAKAIQTQLPKTSVKYTDGKFEDLRNYRVKNDKILNTGWKASYTLEEGIDEILTIVKENRIKNLDDPIYSNEYYLNKHYFNF